MKTNDAGISLIAEFEGFVPNWYPDPAHGWKVPTIGYGHTDAAGSPRYSDDRNLKLTKAEALEILRRDIGQYERAVESAVHVPLNENQYAALVSFTYNLGPGNLKSSTLLRKLNAGDYAGASAQFPRWNKAGGKVLNGLVRRRAAERALFDRPVSSHRPPAKPSIPSTKPATNPLAAIIAIIASIFGRKKP